MKNLLLLTTLMTAACGGNSTGPPAAPTPVPTPPTAVTLTGRLTATNGGQSISGVLASLGTGSATTDGNGAFTTSLPPTASVSLSLTGATIVPRTLQVAMRTTRDLAVDAIALGSQFDLNFYRQLARDANESATLQPLRRWNTNVNLYLQTGADDRTLDMIENVARASVAEWTGGRVGVATVERGSGSREGQAGWLSILFSPEVGRLCGASDIGLSGGSIILYPQVPNCACGGYQMRPTGVRHEVGHSMGLYHSADPADVMFHVINQCDVPITARERYHAAIVYNRPVGNADPDVDALGPVNMAPMRKR